MYNTYRNVKITALRAVVPSHEISIDDEVEYYDSSMKKVNRTRKMVGIDKRRIVPYSVTTSDLCAFAAEDLFVSFPHLRESIDSIIFISQSPDWRLPATACELQHRLSLPKHCATFDVNQGCSGYVYGLWLAGSLIESGASKRVLLLVGDAHSSGRDVRNRITAPVFGDGGSATILEYQKNSPPMHFGRGTDGSGFEAIICPAGASRIPLVREHEKNLACSEDIVDENGTPWQLIDTYMDGAKVFDFTFSVVPSHIQEIMDYAKTSTEKIDYCMLHQANKQIVESIGLKVGFTPEKVPSASFGKYGNLASASIPVALCEEFGTNIAPNNMLLCGYGVGLSWASCICVIEDWDCTPVLEYHMPHDHKSRQDYIEYWQKRIKNQ